MTKLNKTSEANLKAALAQETRALLKGYVVMRHEDRFTHGIPDMSVTGKKITSWWEAKYAYAEKETQTAKFTVKGIQELTLLRLALAGHAFFVVYWECGRERQTYIVDPKLIGEGFASWTTVADGFNHNFVIEHIRKVHGDYL